MTEAWTAPQVERIEPGLILGERQALEPGWTSTAPLLYQGRCCLLRICGRKILPAPSLVAGP